MRSFLFSSMAAATTVSMIWMATTVIMILSLLLFPMDGVAAFSNCLPSSSPQLQQPAVISPHQQRHQLGGGGNTKSFVSSSSSSRTAMLFMANNDKNKDPSRSGTKRDRLNRLADLQEDTVETDKSVFIQAAGALVLLIVVSIAAAASSGLLL